MLGKSIKKVIILLFMFSSVLYAENINKIVIEGNNRVDADYIKALMTSKEGLKYSDESVNRDLKILHGTDLFDKININFKNNTLTVNVVENPIVDDLTFVGNKKFKKDTLEKEITTKKRSTFSINRLNLDIQRITELYYKSGYLGASVSYNLKHKEGNRIEVEIVIKEGKKTTIDQVIFEGNNNYSHADLQNAIITKPARWWRILNPGDVYDRSRIQYDGELLRQFYFENGYPNFSLISSFTEISPSTNKFIVTYTLSEGERYKFGDALLVINVPDLKKYENELQQTIFLDKTSWFKNSVLQKEIDKLKTKIADLGYQFVNVNTQMIYNDAARTVDIVFVVSEESRTFINFIDIKGNNKSKDKVVRRELKFYEGDSYNQDNVNNGIRNLYKTGYFSSVDIQEKPTNEPDKVNLDVNVEETSTGSISIGGGYSTLDKFNVEGSYSETNAFGTGKYFSADINLSANTNTYSLSLADPYFLDKDLYVSSTVFRRETGTDILGTGDTLGSSSDLLYKKMEQGVSFSTGYALTDNLRQIWGYSIYQRNISDVKDGVSISIKELEGKSVVSSVSHTLAYDGTDNAIYPTKGIEGSLVTEYAGLLLGNTAYIKNTFRAVWYHQVYENVVFSALGSVGVIEGLNGQNVNIVDKYTLGGPTLRGFAIGVTKGGVGPYDKQSGESIGGKYMYRGSFQLEAPVPGVKNYGLVVYAFNDFGTVTDFNQTDYAVDSRTLRVSAGVGVSWKSPAGVISLDFGYPLKKEPNDELERIFLNFGTRF